MSTYKRFYQRYLDKIIRQNILFQWQYLIREDFLGPGFVSKSSEFTNNIFEKKMSKNK